MSLDDLLGRAKALGPGATAKAGTRHGFRLLGGAINQIRWFFKRTYGPPADPRGFAERAPEITPELLAPHADALRRITELYFQHRFDLLGSGWVQVRHGLAANGFDGTVYPPEPVPGDITLRLNTGNRAHAVRLRKMVEKYFLPIDWHVDFKSGYRWPEHRVAAATLYGHGRGIDIKVPWELARMQHLVPLAWAFILGQVGTDGFHDPGLYFREFRNQVLDFLAANPPGFGVNWASPMDVAIRAANIALACDLFRRHGATFDSQFAGALASGLHDHGEDIVRRLGHGQEVKGNHYLAEICGLAFIAAYLPRTAATEQWRELAGRELIAETAGQFHPDGGHFEGSTSYHRLCGEMVVYATAILLGHVTFPPAHFEAIVRIATFATDVRKPDGKAAQIGDNDSGRFFKVWPMFGPGEEPVEDHLDHRGLVAAVDGLLGREAGSAEAALVTELVRGLAGGQEISAEIASASGSAAPPGQAPAWNREIVILPPDAGALDGLSTAAYPDFGLYIWRGPRFFLSVRCGAVGGPGPGAHAHNDQLAVELQIDGEDWLADPGSYVYTPDPTARNAYRSVMAHAAPRRGDTEPARLDQGLFRLEDTTRAECLGFGPEGFVGRHSGFGVPVTRAIEIGAGRIVIRDGFEGESGQESVEVRDGPALRAAMGVDIPFSPGYGLKDG